TEASGGDQLTYWASWKLGEPQQVALAKEIKAFTAETGVKVNVQWQGRDVVTKLQPTLGGSPAADLVDSNYNVVKGKMPAATTTDLSVLLTTRIPGENTTISDVLPENARKLGQVDGKLSVLPYQMTCNTVWYDATTFPELAANPPKTWSAFQGLLDKRKEAGKAPLALDADIPGYNAYWFTYLVTAQSGPGAFHRAAADKTGDAWDDATFLTAARRVEELAKGGYFASGYDASKFPAMQQKWANNQSDFVVMGSWLPSETKPYAAKSLKPATFAFPSDGSDSNPVACLGAGWVVPAKARHKGAAEKLIAYLYGKKQAQAIGDATDSLMAREDVTATPTVAGVAELVKKNGTYTNADGVTADYADWWTKVFCPLDDKLVTGRISAADFVSELKSQSVDFWKRA
ncbi:extracellular solute-binding protein, partial [Streptomyces sp. NPDC005373]